MGVADDGEVLGLERDFAILKERGYKSVDEQQDKWNQILQEGLEKTSPDFLSSLTVTYPRIGEKKCCLIDVEGHIREIRQDKYFKIGEKVRKAYWERTGKGCREFVLTKNKQRVMRPPKGQKATDQDEDKEYMEYQGYNWARELESKSEWEIDE